MIILYIESFPVRLPRDLDSARGTAGSPTPLRGSGDYRWSTAYPVIYSVHIETALVKVTLDSGLVGWGEAQAPVAPEVACAVIDRILAPVLIGQEFTTPQDLWQTMYSTMRVRGQTGGFMLDAISGVDIALWDLAGKIAGKPLCELLSNSPKSLVPAYLSGVPNADYARRYRDEGFTKCKLYYDTDWNEILQLMDQLHGWRTAVDGLWHLDPALAPSLDERGALWLEAPLLPEDPIAHGILARSIRTPIALGESYRTCFELAPFFREGAMKIVQPDLGRSGITEGMRIAALSETIVPHVSIALGPQIAAAIHFAAAIENCALCEFNPRVLEVANRFLAAPLRLEGAAYVVPQGPGLGIEMIRDRW